MTEIIETSSLSKVYNLKGRHSEIQALDKVNLSIKNGEIFGLLGPNGAGKTTLIQILTTITQPTSGSAFVNGFNVVTQPKKVKSLIGLMLDSQMLYYRITGYDNLKFFCRIYKIPNYKKKIEKISNEFGLNNWLGQYVSSYSNGMKMKLALCRTLLLERQILVLDEPTLGLDLPTTNFIIEKLKTLKKTIFLTSHDMSVVDKLCDRVAFINKGRILKIGTQNEVKDLMQTQIRIIVELSEEKNELKNNLKKSDFIEDIFEVNEGIGIILKRRSYYKDLFSMLSNYKIRRINEPKISLEELFLKIIE
ncbi:MAG: ABC transporter ATP-binding protein [Promethearchaeota archaeon]